MPRARLAIALALATAIAVLVWQLARGERTSLNSPATERQAPATPENRSETRFVPGPRIVPKSLREADVVEDAAAADSRAADSAHSGARVAVLVVDEASAPQEDVPVFLLEGGHARPVIRRSATGGDGVAFLSLAPKGQAGKAGANSEVTVAIALPLDERVEVVLDRKQMPEGLIRLVLPPTGHVVVRLVTADGATFTGTATVRAPPRRRQGHAFRRPFRRPRSQRRQHPGRRRSGHVRSRRKGPAARSLGDTGRSGSRKVHTLSRRTSRAGESTITLVCGGSATRITGRVVRTDAQPIPGATLSISLPASAEALRTTPRGRTGCRGITGEDGRFSARFEVDPATITGKEARLAIDEPATTPLPEEAAPRPRRSRSACPRRPHGTRRSRRHRRSRPRLRRRGRSRDGEGAAARRGVPGRRSWSARRRTWCRDWSFEGKVSASTSNEGNSSFAASSSPRRRGSGSRPSSTGWTCVEAAPFEVGARDLKVTMVRAGGIAGSIAGSTNQRSAPTGLNRRSEWRSSSPARSGAGIQRTIGSRWIWTGGRSTINEGKFEARSLIPGTYSVEFYAKSRRRGEGHGAVSSRGRRRRAAGEMNSRPPVAEIALSKLLKSRV